MKNLIKILVIATIFLAGFHTGFSQFIQNNSRSIFSDVKGFKVGDAVMVLITEETNANNSASTSDSRSTDLSAGLQGNLNNSSYSAGGGLNTANKFGGTGQTSRKETIQAKISARVIEVDNNGNLKIEGKRTTKTNDETQTIIIQGVVRPVDIHPDNSVYSYNILDLTLLIDGDGTVTKVQQPGLITKFLRILF